MKSTPTTLIEDHSLDLVKHDVSEMSLKNYVKSFAKGDIAIENLAVIDAKLAEIPAIDMYKTQLVALHFLMFKQVHTVAGLHRINL